MNNKKRTIIISDIHGQPKLLDNILEHSNFNGEKDDLVVAGDCVDFGKQSLEVFAKLEKLDATILVGNHEISHTINLIIYPYDFELDKIKGLIGSWQKKIVSGKWKLAHAVDDVLITHAGLSDSIVKHQSNWGISYAQNAQENADALNKYFKELFINTKGQYSKLQGDPLLMGDDGPLWWRQFSYVDNLPADFEQVAGHTPFDLYSHKWQEFIKDKTKLTLIDPHVRGDKNNIIYAAIKNGKVKRIEKVLLKERRIKYEQN